MAAHADVRATRHDETYQRDVEGGLIQRPCVAEVDGVWASTRSLLGPAVNGPQRRAMLYPVIFQW